MALAIAFVFGALVGPVVSAQDGTPEPDQAIDICLVSLTSESETLRVGETARLWAWGVGTKPDGWNLQVDGMGSVGLRGVREEASWAELIELTVVAEQGGEVTVSFSMVCDKPGNGTDSLTLTILPAEPEPTPQTGSEFCAVQLSVSNPRVSVGDAFAAWFVGAGTEQRSWNLTMEGGGSARLLGTRELDPQYVEWQLEAVESGTLRLTGAMECKHTGDGISSSEVVITEPHGPAFDLGAWGTTEIVQVGLMAGLLVVLGVLVYVLIRRR